MPTLDALLGKSIDALNKATARLEEQEKKMVKVETAAKQVSREIRAGKEQSSPTEG